MKLRECLQQTPRRELKIIARLWDGYMGRNPKKEQLIRQLTPIMHDQNNLQYILKQLTAEQQTALDVLKANGGRLLYSTFREQFGDIRSYTPWEEKTDPHPWQRPIGVAEQLSHLGLIFRVPRRAKAGEQVEILIPSDLLSRLPTLPSLTEGTAALYQPQIHQQEAFAFDLALFLSLLHRCDIRPLHDRWLPPKQINALNQRLTHPEDLSQVGSEPSTKRIRLLHLLAEAAKLITVSDGLLKPTLIGWQWLRAPANERYQQLWQATSTLSAELWKRYRLPGSDEEDPIQLFTSLLHHLAQAPVGVPFSLTIFSQQLQQQDPLFFALRKNFSSQKAGKNVAAQRFISETISTLLYFSGIVTISNDAKDSPEPSQSQANSITLTPFGHTLLTGKPLPLSESKKEPPVTLDEQLTITVPLNVTFSALLQIEFIAEWQGYYNTTRQYQLTEASTAALLRRGIPLSELLNHLEEATNISLINSQRQTLTNWANNIQRVRLHQLTILETKTASQMRKLTAGRTIKKSVASTLSARAVVIKESAIPSVQQALHKQAIHIAGMPYVEAAHSTLSQGSPAQFLLTAHIYKRLAQWINLPQPLPISTLNQIEAQLDPSSRTIIEQAATDTIEQLKQVIDGWAIRPLSGAGLPQAETLPLIEQAMQQKQDLQLTYWSAGRNERTNRQVEPQRIQWRGQIAYLIAYCHHAKAERRFRLDRIEQLTPIARTHQQELDEPPEFQWQWG